MPRARARDPIYRQRRFPAEVIETCVRWYITYRLSYRDLVAMMAERDVVVSHTTIMRWVLRYVPEYEARWGRYARPVHPSWRMDETAVRVRGGNHYLYRAVDKHGKSVDSLLCVGRDRAAAQAFFEQAVTRTESGWPAKVNVDGHTATHLALRLLGKKDRRWRFVQVRSNRYLNNIVEQDHRAIKRRCASMLGLKSFRSAAVTFAGIELAHRIRKKQFSLPSIGEGNAISLKEQWNLALGLAGDPAREAIGKLPPMHQNSVGHESADCSFRPALSGRRSQRKMFLGRSLYLLITPSGGRYWRYDYRHGGVKKTLALGVYPDVPIHRARSRHQAARELLAKGVDPAVLRKELRVASSQVVGDMPPTAS